jgi:tetratricopeptide (TPR) repeat protein
VSALTQGLTKARQALQAGRVDVAEGICRELVRKHPGAAEPLYQLGTILSLRGKVSAAVPFWRRAAQAEPAQGQYRVALAHGLAAIGQLEAAVEASRAAVGLEPESADARLQLANLCRRANQLDAALEQYQHAIRLAPESARAYGDLGALLSELGRSDAAIECLCAAVERDPKFASSWANLGAVLHAAGHSPQAIEACRQAVRFNPRHPTAWLTLGNALAEESRWSEAVAAYDAAVAIAGTGKAAVDARHNRSLADLALGNFARGWVDYRLRRAAAPSAAIGTGLPRWGGEMLAGKTLLVRREQGIGTQVMFSGYLGYLAGRARHVVVECDERLRELFARTYPSLEFVSDVGHALHRGGESPDAEAAIGDLPGDLARAGVLEANAAPTPPLLAADPKLVKKWQARLKELSGSLNVGISWRGGGTASTRRKRSTSLADWERVLCTPGVNFVNLQYGATEEELQSLPAGVTLRRWADFDPRRDLDDLAALCVALDQVITIDNSTAHLAAASGTRTWILLPSAADWRWMCDATRSAWYPAARLFRQLDKTSWAGVFERVAGELGALGERDGINSRRTAA